MAAVNEITELTFRGFSAQIRIGDRPLTIYKPDYDEETKTASGWIASEPGKEYLVCWKKNEATEYAGLGCVFIDGPRARSRMFLRPPDTHWIVEKGERVALQKERPFIFSELSTTDDDHLSDTNIPTDPGTITFKIFRKHILSEEFMSHFPAPPDPFSTQLHEKAKKAGGHITRNSLPNYRYRDGLGSFVSIRMGDERDTSARPIAYSRPFTDADREPYVTLVLRYRPEAILRAGGFMPPGEQQPQGEADDDDDNEDVDEDEAQAEAEIAALQAAPQARVTSLAKRKGVKLEDVEADLARKRRKIKQEDAINVDLHFTPGEIIDLTDL